MKDVKYDRLDSFNSKMTPREIKKYSVKNNLPKNVIYKMMEKYYYFEFMKTLSGIIGTDGQLSSREAKKLGQVISTKPGFLKKTP